MPTDVDAKIRKALWRDQRDRHELDRMRELALEVGGWDLRAHGARWVALDPDTGCGDQLGGHDGEWLSVLGGALAASRGRGDDAWSARLAAAIDGELEREARAYRILEAAQDRGVDWVRAAAVLTHNAGDVNQALDLPGLRDAPEVRGFLRLAQAGPDRYAGAFSSAARVYRAVLAAEGHRNYPLRAATALRRHPSLCLPIGPFLDEWGATVATSEHLDDSERAQVVQALLDGGRRVRGQQGYARALAGFARAARGGLEEHRLRAALSASARRALRDSDLRRQLAVPRTSFESACVSAARRAARGEVARPTSRAGRAAAAPVRRGRRRGRRGR